MKLSRREVILRAMAAAILAPAVPLVSKPPLAVPDKPLGLFIYLLDDAERVVHEWPYSETGVYTFTAIRPTKVHCLRGQLYGLGEPLSFEYPADRMDRCELRLGDSFTVEGQPFALEAA